MLGSLDLCVAARQLAEHPAGQQLVDAAVEDDGGERGVEVGAELAVRRPRSMMRRIASIGFTRSPIRSCISGLRAISRTSTRTTSG